MAQVRKRKRLLAEVEEMKKKVSNVVGCIELAPVAIESASTLTLCNKGLC